MPPSTGPPSPPVHSSVNRGEALQHFSPSFPHMVLLSICTIKPLSSLIFPLSFYPFLFFLLNRYSPFFFSLVLPICCCLFPVICLCGDQCYCPWWIPMIQRFREQGATQSPLSCGWAICLCQTSPIHATWADSEKEDEEGMRKRYGQEGVRIGSNILDGDLKKKNALRRGSKNPSIWCHTIQITIFWIILVAYRMLQCIHFSIISKLITSGKSKCVVQ